MVIERESYRARFGCYLVQVGKGIIVRALILSDTWFTYDGWRCIEERELDGETLEARRQYVYGDRYIDEPLIFDNDTDGEPITCPCVNAPRCGAALLTE